MATDVGGAGGADGCGCGGGGDRFWKFHIYCVCFNNEQPTTYAHTSTSTMKLSKPRASRDNGFNAQILQTKTLKRETLKDKVWASHF